jgi:predicted PurR-regulated permease PerM
VTDDLVTPALDFRSAALYVLATSAAVAMLWWAQAVFIPIFLAVLISHVLEPVVGFLERHWCPRPLGVFLVLSALVAGTGYGAYALGDPAATFIDQMPSQARKLRMALESRTRDGSGTIDRVQQAARELERAAGAASPSPAQSGVQRVRIEEPPFRLGDLAWRGSRGLIEFVAEVTIVFFLTYYLLLTGDLYRRKFASMAGPSLRRKRLVLRVLIEVNRQIRRFLVARLLISVIVAVATGGALAALGLNQSVMWGAASGILNVVPYVGPIVAIIGVTIAAFEQFGTLTQTALVCGAASLVALIEGYVLTPRLTGRAGGMNAVTIFVGILFWGWLWGVWGMLLAVPIMTAIKALCARVDGLRPVAALLSE